MQNLWNDNEAKAFTDDLQQRVYSSRLLGQNSDLVLHGGGNTSVKTHVKTIFGQAEEVLYVKGSGWDLETIEAAGFAPVKLDVLQKLAALEQLTDTEMVKVQRAAMLDPYAPNPSVEAILHAIIPFKFVDHTHADAVVTVSNTPEGEQRIRDIYGSRVLIIPYVMPGFILAKKVYELTQNVDWQALEGIILLNHGIFSFANTAKESYGRMIHLVSEAEDYLQNQEAIVESSQTELKEDLIALATIRQKVSKARGSAVIAQLNTSDTAAHFCNLPNVADISTHGTLTPDHVIRTKPIPVIICENNQESIQNYAKNYQQYFSRHADDSLICLNPAPCWAVWPHYGTIAFGQTVKEAQIITDINEHTFKAIQQAEMLSQWRVISEQDIFEMEYWELEQAKLRKGGSKPELQGKIALVTGAASGIGKACAEALLAKGAAVVALDINPHITQLFNKPNALGLVCDASQTEAIEQAVATTIRRFGGLDIVVSNAGIFPVSEKIADMQEDTWNKSLAVNLTGHQRLFTACLPYLSVGIDAAIVVIGSKNVLAPGPGVSAYSVAKAGLTQLSRVAALELASSNIRVNVIHPNAVFDTSIWSDEVLEKRAKHYGLTVEEYKTNNLLKVEVTSKDVAELTCAMAGNLFNKITGAQVPIDGGNERVI